MDEAREVAKPGCPRQPGR